MADRTDIEMEKRGWGLSEEMNSVWGERSLGKGGEERKGGGGGGGSVRSSNGLTLYC